MPVGSASTASSSGATYITVRVRFRVQQPSLVAVAAIERPGACFRVVSELRDLEAAPLEPVVWPPRCPPLDKRDRVVADDELELNLVAGMLWDAAFAESVNLANGSEFDQLGKRHDPERSRPSHEVPNAGATPHVFQN